MEVIDLPLEVDPLLTVHHLVLQEAVVVQEVVHLLQEVEDVIKIIS